MPKLLYTSKGELRNLNGKTNHWLTGETVYCLQLGIAYTDGIIGDKPNRWQALIAPETLPESKSLADFKTIEMREKTDCPSKAYYFVLGKFPEAVSHAVNDFWPVSKTSEARYGLRSINHVMGLRLRKKQDASVIYLYDPNDTFRQRKFVINDPNDVHALKTGHFFSIENQEENFPGSEPSGILYRTEIFDRRDACDVMYLGGPQGNASLTVLSLQFGHYGHPSLPRGLHSAHPLSNDALLAPFVLQHREALDAYCQEVLSSQLSDEEKERRLTVPDKNGVPVLLFGKW